MTDHTPISQNDTKRSLTYTTKFGDVHLREDRLISFPKGLLGPLFHDCTVFGLSTLPDADESPLLVMQCINKPMYSFLVADPASLSLELDELDKRQALKELGLSREDAQFLLIITLYEHGDSFYLTANMRAPLVIDSRKREGFQHILANPKYTTQQKI
ncbi:MAG: hypothetical protein GC134_06250 [Proteobacteria bacterium]|nr:hypothetical protein [Pseudomonadota bacterium]